MSGMVIDNRRASPFSRATILGVILAGFIAFVAMLYFIGAGDTGDRGRTGAAHAASNGLNGFAGLVRLLENEDMEVTLSRTRADLDTTDLLILTPPEFSDPEEFGQILENRQYLGPTLVILPKWQATRPPTNIPDEVAEKFKDGWVQLGSAFPAEWTKDLPEPFGFELEIEQLGEDEAPYWSGLGIEGELPTKTIVYARENPLQSALITDAAGHILALNILGEEDSSYYNDAHWTIFVVDPDLMNNYGLADPQRAAAALALVREAGYNDFTPVTIDLTLHGFGGSTNLLTLAFQPPFLAATICLILAMLIIGWRAFLRFGASAAVGPEMAFGKKRLVTNGAGLIVRARRLGLLAEPYIALSGRKLARTLGLARFEPEAIDHALAVRLPEEEPYSLRAERLRKAHSPTEILRAAQALDELTRKLAK